MCSVVVTSFRFSQFCRIRSTTFNLRVLSVLRFALKCISKTASLYSMSFFFQDKTIRNCWHSSLKYCHVTVGILLIIKFLFNFYESVFKILFLADIEKVSSSGNTGLLPCLSSWVPCWHSVIILCISFLSLLQASNNKTPWNVKKIIHPKFLM